MVDFRQKGNDLIKITPGRIKNVVDGVDDGDVITVRQAERGFVPYIGANANVDLSTFTIRCGGFSIGAALATGVINWQNSANITGSTTFYQNYSEGEVQSDVTTGVIMFQSAPSTKAAAFTLTTLHHFDVANIGLGAASAVTNQMGYYCGPLTSATNNYAFQGNVAAATNRWNLHMAGTAQNYLSGPLGLGVTAPVATFLSIAAGTTAKSQIFLTVSAAPPSAPNDGDIWLESNTNTGLKMRINGVTKTVSLV